MKSLETPGLLWRSLLLLAISCAALWTAKAEVACRSVVASPTGMNAPVGSVGLMPTTIRQAAAGFCLEQADVYLHRASDTTGTVRGRSPAILFWLWQATRWQPENLDVWEMLGREYFDHFNDFARGMRALQAGLLANPHHAGRHVLWAVAGIGCWYQAAQGTGSDAVRLAGIKYLSRAEEEGRRNRRPDDPGSVHSDSAYAVFQTRLYAERGDFPAGWECWTRAGHHAQEESELGRIMNEWKAGGDTNGLRQSVLSLRDAPAVSGDGSKRPRLIETHIKGTDSLCRQEGCAHQAGAAADVQEASGHDAAHSAHSNSSLSLERLAGVMILAMAAMILQRSTATVSEG